MASSQGAVQGAPWWLTIALPFIAVVVTHFLTLHRERQKRGSDWHQRWLDDTKKLLAKISDSAIQHYVDADSVAKTSVSAALIISDIKRLGGLIYEATCVVPSDSKVTSDALSALNAIITDPDDFQDPARAVRLGNDVVCGQIRACEQMLMTALMKQRKRRED
jgi:hypothetical protein